MKVSGTSASILWRIGRTKLKEIKELKGLEADFKAKAFDAPKPLDLYKALADEKGLSVIAEIKKASPSVRLIAEDFDHIGMARAYREAGADAVSVLTDKDYFKGSLEFLAQAKAELPEVPVLRKDFILDEVQIYEGRAAGADSFLLIVAMLEQNRLVELLQLGRSLGMEPLVESHDEEDIERSLAAGARLFGVNNRNLNDFSVDIETSLRLVKMLPPGSLVVSESGLKDANHVRTVFKGGCKSILVGESLMRDGVAGCAERIAAFKGVCAS